jgi:hypothetical protein
LKGTPRIQTFISPKGDTVVQMSLTDAKVILASVLDKEVGDSLLSVYMLRDSLNTNTMMLQLQIIRDLQLKSSNQTQLADNLNQIIADKDIELSDLQDIIKQQKKEIRKQKILKIVGFTSAAVLPVATILIFKH